MKATEAFDAETKQRIVAELALLRPLRESIAHRGGPDLKTPLGLISPDELRQMAALQDLFFSPAFNSHRPIIGRLIVAAKSLLVRSLNQLLKYSLVRQVELNQHSWNVALSIHMLDERLRRIEATLKDSHHAS